MSRKETVRASRVDGLGYDTVIGYEFLRDNKIDLTTLKLVVTNW